jgi:energy-coupling factor transporter transmembrane protein EcfT
MKRLFQLDPSCKLACLALLSIASIYSSPIFASALAILSIIALAVSGTTLGRIFSDTIFVVVFATLTSVAQLANLSIWSKPGIVSVVAALGMKIVIFALRLIGTFSLGKLFYLTTGVSELRDALTRISRRLPFNESIDIGLGISLIVGFIPLIFDEWRGSLEAAHSRGLTLKVGLSGYAVFFASFIRRLMLRAIAIPEALTARGWTSSRGVSSSRWRPKDCFALGLSAILAIGAVRHVV